MPSLPTAGQKPWDLNAWLLVGHDAAGNNLGAGADPNKVDKDSVVVAGTRILASKLLVGHAQPAFRAYGDGKIEWGPGSSTTPDTNLYRSNPGELTTDGGIVAKTTGVGFYHRPATAAGYAVASKVGAEANSRFFIDYNGMMMWSAGATGMDVNLYRSAVNWLKTDYSMIVVGHMQLNSDWSTLFFGASADASLRRQGVGSLVTDVLNANNFRSTPTGGQVGWHNNPVSGANLVLYHSVQGEAQPRFYIDGSGSISWGAGAATPDTLLQRVGVGALYTNGNMSVAGASIPALFYLGGGGFFINSDGKHEWGPGDWSRDTNLYRLSAGYLKSDGGMIATKFAVQLGTPNSMIMEADGHMYFGQTSDVNLYRSGADTLATDDAFNVGGTFSAASVTSAIGFTANTSGSGASAIYATLLASNGYVAAIRQASDAQWRYLITSEGKHMWGPGGATLGVDTYLYRSAAGILKTDGTLEVGVGIKFPGGGVQTVPGTDLSFDGDWVAGTYQEGDTVVKDGIVYLCVGGPTAVAPDPTLWGLASASTVGTALPSSPIDGQEFVLVDSLTAPTYAWTFKYVAGITDGYKWVFIGGSPAAATNVAAGSRNNTVYGDLSDGASPSITAPRAGIYDVNFGAQVEGPGGTPSMAYTAVQVGATVGNDNDLAAMGETGGTTVVLQTTVTRTVRKTAAASDVIKIVYRSDVAGTLNYERRWISVIPVRVA